MTTMSDVYLTWNNSLSSINTMKKYNVSVRLYCEMVFNKGPRELTQQDLSNLNYGDTINKFVSPLREKGVKDSTIKSHLTAMRSFVKMIRREKIFDGVDFSEINNYMLTVDTLSTKDTKHHEAISLEELKDIENWLKKKRYKNDDGHTGEKYAMLIDFMYKTAIRVSAVFSIKWSDFTLTSSPYGGNWAMLDVIDKGKKLNTKSLTRDYYEGLEELFYDGKEDDLVFKDLTQASLRSYFQEYSGMVGKNIVIHSLKAGAATTLYAQTKDLILVRDFCDHESVKTTEAYIHRQKDPNQSGTAILTAEYDYSKLDSLSKEQLLMLIHEKPEIENMIFSSAIRHKTL